jgi:ribosomal protein S3|uniref:Small ribosomal subunit protein uS3c n=1 Tax=Chlamydomonas reinhardtii TaxID=3055 RepID=A0A218N8I0_CHLRE|nr:ribosomal protein S3 [Chlamydomonas reinhardtii]ASF83371.1 ribosomal protein S3 [Chlamydomonas reinhardtii]ASF83439.1 ribosomal protein S3 [Chlamydomonas reinhardtii]ASF83504.1 ribosomal protein S3 [Chlamydomonas reinhardtii]ASF83570.1 ribosomal protein S3 [Chlamydomonas reinhardtii]
MGQKVHPLGFRVGITKKHQSQWFARFQKYAYSQSVFEDHMLRTTLVNLFSNLEKESALATKQSKNRGATQPKAPKITQIKIERGLIPYEIGIQIHSNDCLSITKAIDNIKVSKDLVTNLQKTRKYLFKAGTQLKNASMQVSDNLNVAEGENSTMLKTKTSASGTSVLKKRTFKIQTQKPTKGKFVFKGKRKQKKKLSKAVFMRLKNIKRRFKKRQTIKKRYLNIISKGLLIRKKGNLIIRNVKIKRKNKTARLTSRKSQPTLRSGSNLRDNLAPVKSKMQRFNNRMSKKFANLFLTKLNKQFLVRLKAIMKFWHNQNVTKAPLGYNKKWSLAKSYALINNLKAKYLAKDILSLGSLRVQKLRKLISILEKKSLVKMETLRKDFITFGTLSKTRAFGYYQMITFLKQLKELVTKIKKQTIANVTTKQESVVDNKLASNKTKIQNLIRAKSKQTKSITQKVVNNFVKLVDDNQAMANESRKIKWISYLKDLVNKHRTENIFYYLATIATARKDLNALKRYTKQHANFLFGVNVENAKENPNALLQRVTKTLTQYSKNPLVNNDFENAEGLTKLQTAFLTQIESQRKMYKANLALTPKISIKFFSVKTTNLLEKASTVADSIVDALEKRKAFRGVIKKAKEDLMLRSRVTRVKGVKIQVAGRLNGAEIARSEWVRAGRVPLQTLRANIDYAYRTANTIYGIIGVKVWIFKGYSKI